MKLSNKTKYGIQFMLNLAINYGDNYINIKDFAEKEDISVKFLENIVSLIKPSELIHVKRGASGGYKLSKSPEKIKLLQIIELLEGEFFPVEKPDKTQNKTTDIGQVTQKMITDFKLNITKWLKNKSLADMVKDYQARQDNFMFYI